MEKEKKKLEGKRDLINTKLEKMMENDGFIKSIANKFRNFFDEEEIVYDKDNNIEIIGNLSQQLFENNLRKENFIPYYLKYFYVYKNCFNFIRTLSQRENWENYAPEYIFVNSDDEEEILIKEKNKPNIDSNMNENIRTNKKKDKDLNDLQENIQLKDEIININDGQDNEENNKTISNKFIENKDNSMDREQQNKIVENEKNNEEDKISDNINDNEK